MFVTVNYGANSYGNAVAAKKYELELQPDKHQKEHVDLHIRYEQPAEGRGIGDATGYVKSVRLRLPVNTARLLAQALMLFTETPPGAQLKIPIDEQWTKPVVP